MDKCTNLGAAVGSPALRPRAANGVATRDLSPIMPLVARIVSRYNPLSVWLFGSMARGDFRQDSDWDILFVIDDEAPDADLDLRQAARMRRGLDIAADVVPVKLCEFLEDWAVPGTLPHEVACDGVLLHER